MWWQHSDRYTEAARPNDNECNDCCYSTNGRRWFACRDDRWHNCRRFGDERDATRSFRSEQHRTN